MKLYYWNGINIDGKITRNFGDELNPFIWKSLLGDVFDEDDSQVFIGIGSLLNDKLESEIPQASKKLIFGTGVGYGNRPLKLDDNYKVFCVRGPLSAESLGLSEEYAITDSALLIRNLVTDINKEKKHKYGYMSHWTNHTQRLARLCEKQGLHYIDPTTDDVMKVINEILSCDLVFAEAMHAAIIADSLRVPWVPIRSTPEVIAFKWQDWCKSINIEYAPHTVTPIWQSEDSGWSLKQKFKEKLVSIQLKKMIKTYKPSLSNVQHNDTLLQRLNEKLETLKDYLTNQN